MMMLWRTIDRRAILWLSLYYFVFWFGLIVGNYHYLDDIRRGLDAYPDWSGVHRPLADYLFQFIEFGEKVPSIAPLPQIASVGLAAIGSVMSVRLLDGQGKFAYAAALLIFGNCFYLENASYQYDSMTMALAVVLAIGAAAALKEERFGRRIAAPFIFLTPSFLLYQPAWNAFLVLLFLVTCQELEASGMRSARRLLASAALTTVLAYGAASIICLFTSPHDVYEGQRASIWPISHMVPGIAHNLSVFSHMIGPIVRDQPALLLGLAGALASAVAIALRPALRRGESIAHRAANCGATSLLVILAIVSSVGILLVLRHPVQAPRVLIGCGVLLGGLWILAENQVRGTPALRVAFGAMLGVCLLGQITIAYAYSAALRAEGTYDGRLASRAVEDVYAAAGSHPVDLTIGGVPAQAPFAQPGWNRWVILKWLLPNPLSRPYWNQEVLRSAGLPETVKVTNGPTLPCKAPLTARPAYTLCQTASGLLLQFHR